ncbi:MAG: MBL fold metallo-hydrolase [Candidatus Hodarchaeales archaeon]|jgi:glyoxylase-like metal-dependent hydrolase (beta-lactamase superfamily II)
MAIYTENELARFNATLLSPGVILIRPQNSRQFTSNMLFFDDQVKLMIDTGGFQHGNKRTATIRDFFQISPEDTVLLSHYHLDHTMGSHVFSENQKIIHRSEEGALKDIENFFRFGLGPKAEAEDLELWKPFFINFLKQEGLTDWTDLAFDKIKPTDASSPLDLGTKAIEIIHLPGHSPGHSGVYEPESQLLFIGDIDVGLKFGPWYGWDNADLGLFRETVRMLKEFLESNEISIVVPSHSSPIDKPTCLKRLEKFSKVFDERKRKILEFITQQDKETTIRDLVSQSIIHQGKQIHLWEVFEQIMVEKHLKELEMEQRIYCEGEHISLAT